jgi:3'-5' exoribonuclease
MAKNTYTGYVPIKDLQLGDEVRNVCYSAVIKLSKTKTGKPYLEGQLMDHESAIDLRLWEYTGPLSEENSGTIMCVTGSIGEYNGRLQANLLTMRPALPLDKYKVEDLVPSAPIDADSAFQLLQDRVNLMKDPDYQALANAVLEKYGEEIKNLPAGKSVHHAFVHGLLMHTGTMLDNALKIAESYPDVVNRDLLSLGVIAHDLGKLKEFEVSPLGLVTNYTPEGNLIGHPVMGTMMVTELAIALNTPEEKRMMLQHMLLSHHGDPQFGAAVKPKTAEAILLSSLDYLDSRLEGLREEFVKMEAGTVSGPLLANGGERVYKPTWVGAIAEPDGDDAADADGQEAQ